MTDEDAEWGETSRNNAESEVEITCSGFNMHAPTCKKRQNRFSHALFQEVILVFFSFFLLYVSMT